MITFYSFTAFLFTLLGLLVHKFKMYNLIAGYNTMTDEQKKNVDIVATAKAMGLFFYINALIFVLLLILELVNILSLHPMVLLGYFLVSVFALVFYLQKYDKN